MFKKASKKQSKLRLLLEGASGSGKTYSALTIAKGLGKKIAVIDTEKGSASLYDGKFKFDVCELAPPYEPEKYIEAVNFAEKEYDVLIIDSITHEWSGQGGCLDIQSKLGGRYQDWARVTPRHNKFIESILQAKCHMICTARTKSDYEMSQENGRMKVQKVGLKTEQRDGLDFEFTTVFRLNDKHMAEATKDRTNIFSDLDSVITEDTSKKLLKWLNDGEDPEAFHMKAISESKDIAGLRNAWSSTPKEYQEKLEPLKDEMKVKFEEELSKNMTESVGTNAEMVEIK